MVLVERFDTAGIVAIVGHTCLRATRIFTICSAVQVYCGHNQIHKSLSDGCRYPPLAQWSCRRFLPLRDSGCPPCGFRQRIDRRGIPRLGTRSRSIETTVRYPHRFHLALSSTLLPHDRAVSASIRLFDATVRLYTVQVKCTSFMSRPHFCTSYINVLRLTATTSFDPHFATPFQRISTRCVVLSREKRAFQSRMTWFPATST